MAITRDNWPDAAAVQASLTERFSLPALPAVMDDWFSWCQRVAGQALGLKNPAWRKECGGVLKPGAVDLPGLLGAMEGYRFILDQASSEPGRLVWTDGALAGIWQAHWVVLLATEDGDPLIGDISQPQVPVLWDLHGSGGWAPKPLFSSLPALMRKLEVHRPPQRKPGPPIICHTVLLTDLGDQPMRVLNALRDHEAYAALAPAQLLALKRQLPLPLMKDGFSVQHKARLVARYEGLGAVVEVIERSYEPSRESE